MKDHYSFFKGVSGAKGLFVCLLISQFVLIKKNNVSLTRTVKILCLKSGLFWPDVVIGSLGLLFLGLSEKVLIG